MELSERVEGVCVALDKMGHHVKAGIVREFVQESVFSKLWHSAVEKKPKSSTPMEIHRVLVWRDDRWGTCWSVGWYIEKLDEWRVEGSPNAQAVLFWAEVSPPAGFGKKEPL